MCLLCLDELTRAGAPVLKRGVKLPCAKHGDPAHLHYEKGALWLNFYALIAPYSKGGNIDAATVKIFCDEIGLDFIETFTRLTHINTAYQRS